MQILSCGSNWWWKLPGRPADSLKKQSVCLWYKYIFKYMFLQGGFFDCTSLKMNKCQPLKEISELFLPKND